MAEGKQHIARIVYLIERAIRRIDLDLRGMSVLTEAATGVYAVTPVIAAMAGAERVIAMYGDSAYGSGAMAMEETRWLAERCGVSGEITYCARDSNAVFGEVDIVTNLGFVRPLSSERICQMKRSAVIALMCELWEVRAGDVDLAACRDRGIAVFGTNEHYDYFPVFHYCGLLCMKMLFDAGVEVSGCKILVISSDPFGEAIEASLLANGAKVVLVDRATNERELSNSDAIIVADYLATDVLLGDGAEITGKHLRECAPGVTVLQFCGLINRMDLQYNGIRIWPATTVQENRMALTLAGLGPRPVIDLHTAGLKAAEIAVSIRRKGDELTPETVRLYPHGELVQPHLPKQGEA